MKNKKLLIALSFLFIVCLTLLTVGCVKQVNTEDYIRLHIRADSNDAFAQAVKLKVRDEIVGFLSVKANTITSKEQMLDYLYNQIPEIEARADKVLAENGLSYHCKAQIRREDFPEKTYGDLTLPEGNYLALILELGSGKGQNWWCVAYPPLCFIASEDTEGDTVEYRSIIADFFRNLTEKK